MKRSRMDWWLMTCLVVLPLSVQCQQAIRREKVAEAEYLMRYGAPGQAEKLPQFRETWTLFRTGEESYEVEGQGRFDVPDETVTGLMFRIRLGPDLRPTALEIKPEPTEGWEEKGLECYFDPGQVRCEEYGDERILPIKGIYDFDPHMSTWFASSLVRRAERIPGKKKAIQWVYRTNPGPREVPSMAVFPGEVRFVGEENVEVNGQREPASKFEVNLFGSSRYRLWLLPDGVVYAVQDEDAKQAGQRMELVRYVKYAEFGPGKR